MNIYGKRIMLRAMTKADTDLILGLLNDPEIEHQVGGWSFPLSAEQQARWFDNHMNDEDKRFIIEDSEYGAVGILTLSSLNWKNRNATLGLKIAGSEHRGKGIGTDAYMAILRYCFDELGLHRINSNYLSYNIASKALHKKCGFVEEGCLREVHYQGGKWIDLITNGLLEEDYRKLIAGNHYWD